MQDKAIAAIGRLALQKGSQSEPYLLYVQNMFPSVNYDMILSKFSLFKGEDQLSCEFAGVDVEKVSETTYSKYLYRGGSPRGGDVTFTTKSGDLAKKLNTLLTVQLKNVITLCRSTGSASDLALLLALQQRLTEDYTQVLSELQDVYGQLDKKRQQSSGFSICFEYEGKRLYLADFSIFQHQVLLSGTSGKSEKYGVTSQGKDQFCSVCLQKKPLLHGFASPFKYATVDKPGMVSGFFDQRGNWKNYPICSDCSLEFEYGQKYVSQKLRKYFYGSSYFAIPKTVLGNDKKGLDQALNLLTGLEFQLDEAEKERRVEDRIMQEIGKETNYFTLNLLFFDENPTTKAIKIKLLLEEILPSRFRKLFSDTPAKVNPNSLYKAAYRIKKEPYDLKFSFGLFKQFYEDDFYSIVNDVFVGRPINKQTLYSRFMAQIRANYNKAQISDSYVEPAGLTILKAHLLLNYLADLSLITVNPITMIQNENLIDEEAKVEQKYGRAFDEVLFQQFVANNTNFLDDNYKVGIFAVGVLVRLLLNIQQRDLGGTPFEKKLKGYKLDPATLKTVYLETVAKLAQYRDYGRRYESLSRIISEYFILNSHQLHTISNNELSFYFVAGLEMAYRFRIENSQTNETKVNN
ncbi:TIGR02556 family CRISPR-associated protein [Siphonobacter sp. SORGH_AS_1065]|uniref:TIGR02556 family CRISPR-associated protein n=1 Tax=Siphonobacter sp. SORGH_AS_1065 TaxID=3041795 RepID=UPI002788B76F|nr:TIGR02556 family CRISPR-associated protein [Siphonobacter sp. SORGH_AS_1065]MDQ1086162.1 CRISPR-associated protein Csh1 [Siphonobacter sp. SORGH_AS_1065]